MENVNQQHHIVPCAVPKFLPAAKASPASWETKVTDIHLEVVTITSPSNAGIDDCYSYETATCSCYKNSSWQRNCLLLQQS